MTRPRPLAVLVAVALVAALIGAALFVASGHLVLGGLLGIGVALCGLTWWENRHG